MTIPSQFIHLHVHTAYSLAEGAIPVKVLLKRCRQMGMPAVAITDTNNMFGAMEFSTAAAKEGIQPIIGCQISVMPNKEAEQAEQSGYAQSSSNRNTRESLPSLVLLAQSDAGYRGLMALMRLAYLRAEDENNSLASDGASASLAEICAASDGLICLTGGHKGLLNQALVHGQQVLAESNLLTLKQAFEDRLYIELNRHGLDVETINEPALLKLAIAHDVPIVATNNCYFLEQKSHAAHDALLCIAAGAYLIESERRRETPEHYLKSAAEMAEIFADLPEAITNTAIIAQRCHFLLQETNPQLPSFPTQDNRTVDEELRIQAENGLEERLLKQVLPITESENTEAVTQIYRDRLAFEVDVINKMGFAGYFLIVSDFIRWAKAHGIPVGPGRGSGAGSLVAWSLLITDLDPIRFGLLFERFLNPERVSMPDFDIDFCQERRDEVLNYVQSQYGTDKVAQIITFGTLQARAVLRDVGRVMQLPYGLVDKICKLVPNNPASPVTLQQALDMEPQLGEIQRREQGVPEMITCALELEGLYRHASTHAAGVVIGRDPLHEMVPLYRDPRSTMPVTQYSMKYVEMVGLVKFDFLGLKTLTVLQTALKWIDKTLEGLGEGQNAPDLLTLPFDDAKTYALLSRAETVGVFQLESAGMRDVLRRLKPDRFEDIIALVSLYRPGPMDNIPKYIDVRLGREKPEYLHPLLEPILRETNGIMIYQEQVMQAAQSLAGYSLGGADLLRRAMGKKIKEAMDAEAENFVVGCLKNGLDEGNARNIFEQIAKFAGYGFNKSHAAAYALIAYQTGYLKANHTVSFVVALMTHDIHNTDKLSQFCQEAASLGISVLPPDVNASYANFAMEAMPKQKDDTLTFGIRYALGAIKGVGEQAMELLVEERRENGAFKSIYDFIDRLPAAASNRRILEKLICAGALDSLNKNRAQLLSAMEVLEGRNKAAWQDRQSSQNSLFGGGMTTTQDTRPLPATPNWSPLETLEREQSAIGFYLSGHPLDSYRSWLKANGIKTIAEVKETLENGANTDGSTRFSLAGVILAKKEKTSPKGNRYAFVQLSDSSGAFEVTLWSEDLAKYRENLNAGSLFWLSVNVAVRDEDMRLTVAAMTPLEEKVMQTGEHIGLNVTSETQIAAVRDVVQALKAGRTGITLSLDTGQHTVDMELKGSWHVPPPQLDTLTRLGVGVSYR